MLDIHVVFVQVIRSLKRALQPSITDISVDFMVPKEVKIIQSPKNLPPVFNGEKLVVYATLKAQKALDKKVQCTATLKGNMLGATVEYQVPFVLDSSAAAPSLPVIHHLAAKALITDWETEEKEKKSIVDLSIESSVISSHTAFIAIDEESSEPVSGSMKTYDIHPASYPFGALYWPAGSICYGSLSAAAEPPPPMSYGAAMPSPALGASPSPLGFETDYRRSRKRKAPKSSFDGLVQQRCMDIFSTSHYHAPRSSAPPPSLQGGSFGGPPPSLDSLPNVGLSAAKVPTTKFADNLVDLATAQQLNGSWELTSSFAQLIGKLLSDLEAACPIGREGVWAAVWATVLAVSLLRSRYSSQQDEWELIAMKAESWLKKQSLPPGTTLEKFFQDAQKQLQ